MKVFILVFFFVGEFRDSEEKTCVACGRLTEDFSLDVLRSILIGHHSVDVGFEIGVRVRVAMCDVYRVAFHVVPIECHLKMKYLRKLWNEQQKITNKFYRNVFNINLVKGFNNTKKQTLEFEYLSVKNYFQNVQN